MPEITFDDLPSQSSSGSVTFDDLPSVSSGPVEGSVFGLVPNGNGGWMHDPNDITDRNVPGFDPNHGAWGAPIKDPNLAGVALSPKQLLAAGINPDDPNSVAGAEVKVITPSGDERYYPIVDKLGTPGRIDFTAKAYQELGGPMNRGGGTIPGLQYQIVPKGSRPPIGGQDQFTPIGKTDITFDDLPEVKPLPQLPYPDMPGPSDIVGQKSTLVAPPEDTGIGFNDKVRNAANVTARTIGSGIAGTVQGIADMGATAQETSEEERARLNKEIAGFTEGYKAVQDNPRLLDSQKVQILAGQEREIQRRALQLSQLDPLGDAQLLLRRQQAREDALALQAARTPEALAETYQTNPVLESGIPATAGRVVGNIANVGLQAIAGSMVGVPLLPIASIALQAGADARNQAEAEFKKNNPNATDAEIAAAGNDAEQHAQRVATASGLAFMGTGGLVNAAAAKVIPSTLSVPAAATLRTAAHAAGNVAASTLIRGGEALAEGKTVKEAFDAAKAFTGEGLGTDIGFALTGIPGAIREARLAQIEAAIPKVEVTPTQEAAAKSLGADPVELRKQEAVVKGEPIPLTPEQVQIAKDELRKNQEAFQKLGEAPTQPTVDQIAAPEGQDTTPAPEAATAPTAEPPVYRKDILSSEPPRPLSPEEQAAFEKARQEPPPEPVEFVLPKRAEAAGDVMVDVDVKKFDEAFAKDKSMYVSPTGEGEIAGRRAGFEKFLEKGGKVEVPEVHVDEKGNVAFTNGRHRYSVLRDKGQETVKMAMTPEAANNARKAGLLREPPAEPPPAAPEAAPAPAAEPEGTSIKNAQIDADRVKHGLPPILATERKSDATTWDNAMRRIEEDPDIGTKLVDRLEKKTGPHTDEEAAILRHRRAVLELSLQKAGLRADAARESGVEGDIQEARMRTAEVLDELDRLHNVLRTSRRELGRGLRSGRVELGEDISPATLLRKETEARNRKLEPQEAEEVLKKQKVLQAAKDAADAAAAKVDEKQSVAQAEEVVKDMVKAQPKPRGKQKPKPAAVEWLKEKADQARENIRKRREQGDRLFSGPADPEELTDYAIIGASRIAEGITDFVRWSAEMVKEFGEGIQPYLKLIFDQAQPLVKRATEGQKREKLVQGIKTRLQEGDKPEQLGRYAQRLAETFVREGITKRDELVREVHKVLQSLIPDFTERQARDAISGYGDFKQLDQEDAKRTLRDLKGQMQQVSKIEDMQAKQAPKKTGVERRIPSDEERRLIKEVNELKKKGGFAITDPATQLRTAMEAVKTRLRNQISDLDYAIANKEPIVTKKGGIAYDAEAVDLRRQRDARKAEYDTIFGKKGLTDEQRLKAAISAAERSAKEYEDRVRNKDLTGKPRSKPLTSPELEAAKARRNAAKAQLEELRSLDPEYQKQAVERQIESALKSYKSRKATAIAELQEKLAKGDISKKPRRTVTLDPEAIKLQEEYQRLKLDMERQRRKIMLEQRGRVEKTLDGISKWRRAFVLSGVKTLAKLTSAAGEILVISPVEELVQTGYAKVLPFIASRAPRRSGINLRAEVRSVTETWRNLFRDIGSELKTGQMDIDVLYGKPKINPPELKDYVANVHGALKSPARRAEFTRSFEKRIDHYVAAGVDVTDPLVQTRAALEAYKDASKSIFQESNILADAYRRALSRFSQPDKLTGKPSLSGKVGETLLRYTFPVVRIPTNIVARTFEYMLGTIPGTYRLSRALVKGIEHLQPDEADLIMQNLSRGSIGAAVLLVGYFNPDVFGGYWQQGEKRKEEDVKAMHAKINGVDIPTYLLHHPLLMAAQVGATVRRVADSKLRKKDKEAQGITQGLVAGGLGLIEEIPFMREMVHTVRAFNPYERGLFMEELGKATVPIGISQIAQWMDENDPNTGETVKRKGGSFLEGVQESIPGLRQNVPIKEEKKPAKKKEKFGF